MSKEQNSNKKALMAKTIKANWSLGESNPFPPKIKLKHLHAYLNVLLEFSRPHRAKVFKPLDIFSHS